MESDIAFARICSGKISPVMTQAIGPQVDAKKAYMPTLQRYPGVRNRTYDVDTNECNQNLLAGNVLDGDGDTDDGDNEFADTHSNCTHQQEATAAETLNTPHSGQRREHVDDVGGDRD